jgi:NAD(P)-dependent dehydrogenase (short-subunit alcohol dehydrogenase family)
MKRLEQRIAVVTGSANGIGLATARLFAAEGAHVWLTDIDGEGAERGAAEIRALGGLATARTVDVSRGQDVTALFRDVAAAHEKVDVLVNNAGVNVRSDFRHMTDEDWVRLREVNLDGVVRMARDGFDLLRRSGSGSLINIASIMGHRGLRHVTAYSATKGAVSALTRGLAVDYAPFGIRVNALAPGFVETAMTHRLLKNPHFRKALLDKKPLRRFGTPSDIAEAALFFASDASAWITGAELAVDGGMAAQL